jgi:hypothetical protein
MKRAKSTNIHDRLEVLEAGVITSSRLREAAGAGRVAPDLRAGWTSMARTMITDSVVRTGTARAVAVVSRLAVFGMVLLVLGVPITDLWRFLFLVAAVVAICFGNIRHWGPRWLIALTIAIGGAAAAWLIQGPQIQEGNNVYIPVGESLKVFEAELPQQAQAAMKSVFEHAYFTNTDGLPGSADWWQYPAFATPGYFTKHAFAPSADALWEQPKYSRIVDMIDFRNQDQARIRAINRSRYNFYHRHRSQPHDFDTAARIDRSAMPYFVMAEINSELSGGKACWRGDVLWEDDDGKFSLAGRDAWGCQSLGERDIGKRVFALAIKASRIRCLPKLATEILAMDQAGNTESRRNRRSSDTCQARYLLSVAASNRVCCLNDSHYRRPLAPILDRISDAGRGKRRACPPVIGFRHFSGGTPWRLGRCSARRGGCLLFYARLTLF